MSQHLDYREIALKALVADGTVNDAAIAILKKDLKASTGNWFQEGVKFLVELRDAYTRKAKAKKEELSEAFEKFFFKVVTESVLKDEAISEHEAGWLKETLFADGKIDDREWDFLQTLNKKAKTKSNAFIELYAEAEKKRNKPAGTAATPKATKAPKVAKPAAE